MTSKAQFQDILAIFRRLPKRRRKQFFIMLVVMLLGGMAEFVAIGAVVPFIGVMADPAGFLEERNAGFLTERLAGLDTEQLRLLMALLFVGVVVLSGSIRVFLMWLTTRYASMVAYDLSAVVYRNIIQQDYMFHLTNSSAELVAALTKIDGFSQMVLKSVMDAITAAVTTTFILSALLLVNFTVAMSALVITATIYMVIVFFVRPLQRRNSVVIAAARSEKVRLVQEGFGGIRDIIVNGLQGTYTRRFSLVDYGLRMRQVVNSILLAAPKTFIETLLLVLACVGVYIAADRMGDLNDILPTVAAFALGLQRMMPKIQQIYSGYAKVNSNSASTADVRNFIAMEWPKTPVKARIRVDFAQALELDRVSFSYGDEGRQAIEDITLTIPKGTFFGITGPSGSGKSTLVDLIMGLQLPTSGALRVDGVEIDRERLPGWRSRIAHVSQSVFLIEASISENIAFGVPPEEIDKDRLQTSVRLAELESFVAELDDGLDTKVGERGARLSGGQRQRIGIARALYLNRDVLVLDEATSALDNATQEKVMHNIRAMKSGITILSITHRLDTLKGCDTIVELEKGRIKSVTDQPAGVS